MEFHDIYSQNISFVIITAFFPSKYDFGELKVNLSVFFFFYCLLCARLFMYIIYPRVSPSRHKLLP